MVCLEGPHKLYSGGRRITIFMISHAGVRQNYGIMTVFEPPWYQLGIYRFSSLSWVAQPHNYPYPRP